MHRTGFVLAIFAFWLTGARQSPAAPTPAACESLARLKLDQTEITSAKAVPAGPFALPAGNSANLPVFCRVAGIVRPTPDSEIRFEVWMPVELRATTKK